MHLNVPVIDVLLFISILLLVLSISWLFLKLKNESSSLLGQVQNLFDQFKIINRSSELITSSNAPKDILNVITIEAGKIITKVLGGYKSRKTGGNKISGECNSRENRGNYTGINKR